MPTIPGGQRRLLFIGNVKTNLVNKYTAGSSIGAVSTSTRRALKRRATSSAGRMDVNGKLIPGKPCCPVELERKPKLISHKQSSHSFVMPNITIGSELLYQ
jgi:hypothetical protein|tara:strand:- start:583 stop:885 length:303 start_codon:yes stop_codon:yes gene_type:complete